MSLTGAILTKLDGDSRGGAALSVRATSGKPIKFTGVGEKMEALEVFYPDRMAQRILGMGDVLSLVEKAEEAIAEEEAEVRVSRYPIRFCPISSYLIHLVKSKGSIYPGMTVITWWQRAWVVLVRAVIAGRWAAAVHRWVPVMLGRWLGGRAPVGPGRILR